MTTALLITALLGIAYCAIALAQLLDLVKECIARLDGRRW